MGENIRKFTFTTPPDQRRDVDVAHAVVHNLGTTAVVVTCLDGNGKQTHPSVRAQDENVLVVDGKDVAQVTVIG